MRFSLLLFLAVLSSGVAAAPAARQEKRDPRANVVPELPQ